MARALDDQPRTTRLAVRLSPAEYATLTAAARDCGLAPSTLLRQLGLAFTPRSTVDREAVVELALLRAELGRIGGLLKLWLTNREREQLGHALQVPAAIDSLRRSEATLLAAIERLVSP